MESIKSFKAQLFSVNDLNFEKNALRLFKFQAQHNKIYAAYIKALGITPSKINDIAEIPFLPISFFKTHPIKTGDWKEEIVFESSGTTGEATSKMYVEDIIFYQKVAVFIFQKMYGHLSHFNVLALLPSYLERKNASLVYMVDDFIKKSRNSGFFLDDISALIKKLTTQKTPKVKTLLIGVSFALLDLAEAYQFNLKDTIIMETGGMKGRRKELTRNELHTILKDSFGVKTIHSEYGMTELTSQAYAKDNGLFHSPPWVRILIRDINDPFSTVKKDKSGGINIIDLANITTCAFIETKDLGRLHENNDFEVLGRFDNSDVRGCNLMVVH